MRKKVLSITLLVAAIKLIIGVSATTPWSYLCLRDGFLKLEEDTEQRRSRVADLTENSIAYIFVSRHIVPKSTNVATYLLDNTFRNKDSDFNTIEASCYFAAREGSVLTVSKTTGVLGKANLRPISSITFTWQTYFPDF